MTERDLFSSLRGLSDEQIKTLAVSKSPPAMEGTWILTAPNGREYAAESPLRCCGMEQRERIPPLVAIARVYVCTFLESDDVDESIG